MLLARPLGVPSMLYAVGVGPLRSPEARQLTGELFEAADGVTVRDAPSRELLAELGCSVEAIEVVPDPAFHLPRGAADPAIAGVLQGMQRPILGVSLRYWASGVVPAEWQGGRGGPPPAGGRPRRSPGGARRDCALCPVAGR